MRASWILACALVFGAWAQEKPDYSGTWKLDPQRSRMESIPGAKQTVLKIEQQDPKIRIAIGTDKSSETMELTTDGAEQKVTYGGQPATASALFDDGRLILTIARETDNGPVTETRRAKLGDKGKMLTTIMQYKDKSGEKTAYGFYVKE